MTKTMTAIVIATIRLMRETQNVSQRLFKQPISPLKVRFLYINEQAVMSEEHCAEDEIVPLDIRKTLIEFRSMRHELFLLFRRFGEIENALIAALGWKEFLKLLDPSSSPPQDTQE